MNYLGSNLKYLRKTAGLTQEKLAAKIGVKRSLIGAYEEQRSEPRLQTIQNICHYFKINIEQLVNTDLSKGVLAEQHDISGQKLRILPITVDAHSNRELPVLVPGKAAAGYLQGYADVDYIESLPRFDMPFPELPPEKTYRMFQISGDSMLPVPSGAYVLGEYVQNWSELKNEKAYIVVSREEGIVFKRIINNLPEGSLRLKSDNPLFEAYDLPASDILELWEAKSYTSFGFPVPDASHYGVDGHLEGLLSKMQQDISELKNRLDNHAD